jgi:hypothetical protein
LARDLASFAIDGGTMIVGLAEDKQNSTFSRAPVAPAGATGEGRTGTPFPTRLWSFSPTPSSRRPLPPRDTSSFTSQQAPRWRPGRPDGDHPPHSAPS